MDISGPSWNPIQCNSSKISTNAKLTPSIPDNAPSSLRFPHCLANEHNLPALLSHAAGTECVRRAGGPVWCRGKEGRIPVACLSGAIPVCCDFSRLSYSRQFGMKGFCMLQERDTMSTLAGSLSSACWGRGLCTAPRGCLWYRVSGMNRCNYGTRHHNCVNTHQPHLTSHTNTQQH